MLTSHRVGGLLMLLMVSGCADNPPAPIETRGKAATASSGATSQATSTLPDYGPNLVPGKPYTVQKGDTLDIRLERGRVTAEVRDVHPSDGADGTDTDSPARKSKAANKKGRAQ